MNQFKYLAVIGFMLASCVLVSAQHAFLESTNEVVVGPKQVSWVVEAQVPYYIELYTSFKDNLYLFIEDYKTEINTTQAQGKLKRKNRNQIKLLEGYIEETKEEIEILDFYIELWKQVKLNNNPEDVLELAGAVDCFHIHSEDRIYEETEYELLLPIEDNMIYWEEIIPKGVATINGNDENENRVKWVKVKSDKNCLSRDPKDCLVWCLIPEDPSKAEQYLSKLPCDLSSFTSDGINCVRKRMLQLPSNSGMNFLLVNAKTQKEIIISKLERVDCQE